MGVVLEVLLPAFVACLVLTGIHTYLGLHVVSRGVIFVDLALAQIAALGATFAFLLGHDPAGTHGYLYSLGFTFVGAAIFSLSRLRDERIPQEAIIGITFAVASAGAILIADRAPSGAEHVEQMLTGALLWVPWPTIVKTGLIYAGIGAFHWFLRHRFLTISLEPERAHEEGWSLRWWDFLFYTSFGFVITSSVAMAGILLVFSFLIIPSVIAMLFSRSIRARLVIGWSVGTIVSMSGLSLSYAYDLPSGPAVVVTFGMALVLAGVVRYVAMASSRATAVAKVGTATAVLVAGLWLAFTFTGAPEAGTTGLAVEHGDEGTRDPAQVAQDALARLTEVSDDEPPPADVVRALVSLADELHRLMASGGIRVEAAAVAALARGDEPGLDEVLEEIAHHAEDPWARLEGAHALITRGDVVGVEALLELLESDVPPFLQLQAAETLREVTGEDFGFDPQADRDSKAEAVRRWRTWWRTHRGETLLEPGPS